MYWVWRIDIQGHSRRRHRRVEQEGEMSEAYIRELVIVRADELLEALGRLYGVAMKAGDGIEQARINKLVEAVTEYKEGMSHES